MTNPVKVGLYLVVAVFAVLLAVKLIAGILSLLLPLAIVAGIGLILYGVICNKCLGGNGPSLR